MSVSDCYCYSLATGREKTGSLLLAVSLGSLFLGFHPWIQQFLLSSFHPRPMYMAGRSMQKACRRADAGVERAEISEFQGLSLVSIFWTGFCPLAGVFKDPPANGPKQAPDKEEADGTQACFQARPSQGTPGLSLVGSF